MNIWINNPFDNLEEEGARPQRYAMLSAELVRRGHAVVWWTSAFSHVHKALRVGTDGRTLPPSYTNDAGVLMRLLETRPYRSNVSPSRVLSHKAYAETWFKTACADVRDGALARPDIILSSLPPLATHRAALRLRERFGSRLFVDIQDAWPEAFEGLLPLPAPLAKLAYRTFFASARETARRAFLTADKITGVGKSYLDLAAASGTAAPLGEFRLGITDAADAVTPVTDGPVRVVYAGNMGKSYDLVTLIRAVIDLEKTRPGFIRLDLAGTGPDERKLRSLADGCAAVQFHGFLWKDALEALLRTSEIGIVPMFDRSFVAVPNKIADYAASGLAVVNCLTGETRDLVASATAGAWYPAGDVGRLAEVLAQMASDRTALLQMRRNALALAKREFLASSIYPALCDFLLDSERDCENGFGH